MKYQSEGEVQCRFCGEYISLVKTAKGVVPVDLEIVRFTPGKGPQTFYLPDGHMIRGRARRNGTHTGYMNHKRTCKNGREQNDDR